MQERARSSRGEISSQLARSSRFALDHSVDIDVKNAALAYRDKRSAFSLTNSVTESSELKRGGIDIAYSSDSRSAVLNVKPRFIRALALAVYRCEKRALGDSSSGIRNGERSSVAFFDYIRKLLCRGQSFSVDRDYSVADLEPRAFRRIYFLIIGFNRANSNYEYSFGYKFYSEGNSSRIETECLKLGSAYACSNALILRVGFF